ncbi:hypothetical protein BDY19DRAFT_942423 [Irpex rosettiformis]|uniref:Uncharacterized protein n=1 Tax=Irpex rosettiformis TaxID=378272 RepID=A0ACB8U5I7_9APHY|nr:hypothetical protein BDY19DRAFT_942423 [Irpex rosettiformis]
MSASSSRRQPPDLSRQDQYRPRSIAELAADANEGLWEPSRPLKHWLRTAEKARKTGNSYVEAGDYELAFIEYARAATLVLEKLPTHREYQTLLTANQRANLGLNGQEILDNLSELKPLLVDQYEAWIASGGSPNASTRPPPSSEPISREESARRKRDEERALQAQEAMQREVEWRMADNARRQVEERERRAQEEAAWARQPQEVRQRELDETKRIEAREAAEYERAAARRGYVISDEERKEEEKRRRQMDRRREEQEGILRRQQEAEAAARAVRRDIVQSSSLDLLYRRSQEPEAPPRSTLPDTSGSYTVTTPQSSRPGSTSQGRAGFSGPSMLPVESPMKYEDDTDTDERSDENHLGRRGKYVDRTPSKVPNTNVGIAYPIPITTTSPAPPDFGHVEYPTLMSQHQLKQGYAPSLRSMFSQPNEPPPSTSLLLETKPSSGLYANILPKPSAPPMPYYVPSMPIADPFQAPRDPRQTGSQRGPSPINRPPLPQVPPPPQPGASRIVRGASADNQVTELRSVKMPRDCLSRFLSIARVNTERNKETCGLLLGKEAKGKYVVSVLLIPKQHSTSDTCTMDEEELVLQITEQRKLITLGWIHTHPTQSCFMSSVDLHTHSGFQRMLPESFAVVCAPSSKPTFGIFRLTDPVGLQTILECNAKEAFHPHPDVAIYTDCDSNHVQIKDIPIEIIDLR